MNKFPTLSEKQIQQQIMHYLRAKGWYCMRLNSGKYSVGEGRSARYIMGQEAGTPDLVAFKNVTGVGEYEAEYSDLIFVEVKVPGNKPTELQTRKMEELEGYGARCLVIHSFEELEKEL